jgi:hypothetical protein
MKSGVRRRAMRRELQRKVPRRRVPEIQRVLEKQVDRREKKNRI